LKTAGRISPADLIANMLAEFLIFKTRGIPASRFEKLNAGRIPPAVLIANMLAGIPYF